MGKITFLNIEQILAIHFDQIENYGGTHGIRENSLLESACQRPQASFGGEDLYISIFDKAAALMHSLILNHPFLDGNKRTGMASAIAFLYLNGFQLNVDQKEFVEVALLVASKEWDPLQISSWLKENSVKN